jgi:hypothetical protein
MKRKRSIQLKAAFLMIVFSLNTIIGFACAVGIDMGFNTSHHHDEDSTEAPVHVHADGKKHIHHNEVTKHHHEADNDQHKSKNGKDDCCKDKVMQFSQLDKSVPRSLSVINPIFFLTFVSIFYNIEILFPFQASPNIKYFVRSHHPPIPDIRIAIQSFQI